jgi:APA family basic amino acid/polyamine antiporter
MIPQWFAKVDARTGTPINATIVMLVATAVVAFFTKLEILANLLSVSTSSCSWLPHFSSAATMSAG